MSSHVKLEVLNSAFKGKQFRLSDGLLIGSDAQCQIRAQHPDLRPVHLRFSFSESRPIVEIVDREAHLFVNGQDVVRSELKHNDRITAGPIRLRVVDEALASHASLRLDQLLAEVEMGGGADEVFDFAKEDLFYLCTKDAALKQRISFGFPSRDKFIDQAQVFLARLVKHSGAEESQIDAFMTCSKELILNAHRHGHKYDESKRVVVRFRDQGKKLTLTIEDEGDGFDHRAVLGRVHAKDAATAARERYQAGGFGGLGFQLITKLASEISYNDKGNVVTFSVLKKAAAG